MAATLEILENVLDAVSRVLDATVHQGDDVSLENVMLLKEALAGGIKGVLDALRQFVQLELLGLLAVLKQSTDLQINISFVRKAVV